MVDIPYITKKLSGHYNIWRKNKNQDLDYYFANLFEPSLDLLRERVKSAHGINLLDDADQPKYKRLLVPIGYSLGSVALMSCLLQPEHITLAHSESLGGFFRKIEHLLKENINKHSPNSEIETMRISGIDHKIVEKNILSWIETMTTGGIPLAKIALDITGGLKSITVGIQNVAQALGIDAYYLHSDYDEDTESPIPGTENLIQMSRGIVDDKLIFVIMPFADEFKNVYDFGIKSSIESMDYKCIRVDEEIFLGGIMEKIRKNIAKARFIVADISVYNPNVYYELGLAEGMGKDIIMLTSNVDTLPFDLRHKRVIPYNDKNLKQLSDDLKKNLQELA